VFKRPSGALAAALAIQRRVGSRSWPAGAKVRLRIGIHTGRPALTDGGYVGLAVQLRLASALPVTAVKSCSRATRYERSRHRLLATSAFAA
jgi:class 3 adenylate cyclase